MWCLLAIGCSPEADPATRDPTTGPADTDTPDTDTDTDTDTPDTDTDDTGMPCIEDALEDNDDLNSAVPWSPEPMMVFEDDMDFFLFELEPGDSRRIELTFDHTHGNIDLAVFNELSILVGSSYSASDDEAVEVTNTSTVPTTARFRVQLRDPGCNTYTIDVREP